MTDDSITLTVEIDPTQFDEPRQMMYDRLCEEFGQDTVTELLKANIGHDFTQQGMQLVNMLWDNRDQIAVDEAQPVTPEIPDATEDPDE
jgi:hypothetical protein